MKKFFTLAFLLCLFGMVNAQTLATYKFENNLSPEAGAIGSPSLTYSISSPTYNAGVSGVSLTTGTAASSNGAFLELSISTIGYSDIKVSWAGRTSNATAPAGTWQLKGDDGSGYGSALFTQSLSTTFANTGDIALGNTFDNKSNIKLKITAINSSLRNLRIDDLIITGTTATLLPCTAPTAVSTVSYAAITGTSFNGSITAPTGGADGYLVFYSTTQTSAPSVTDGTTYSATNQPSGYVFVKSDAATSFSLTGLTESTTYNVFVFAYKNTGCTGGPAYAGAHTSQQATLSPCVAPTAVTSSSITLTPGGTNIGGTFTSTSATAYTVFYSTNSSAPTLANGTTYTSANAPAGYTFVQNSNTTSFNITGLSYATGYYVYVFANNNTNCSGGPVYAAVASANTTTNNPPDEGLQISAPNTRYTIDFDNTVAKSNTGQFAGTDANTSDAAGTLNSNAWSFNVANATAAPVFGQTLTSSGGIAAPGVVTASINFFSMTVATGNQALAVQPTGSNYAPGQIALKVQNKTGAEVTKMSVGFTAYHYNDQPRAQSIEVSYSVNGTTFVPAPSTIQTIATADNALHASYFVIDIPNLNIPANGYFYIRWATTDFSGSGSRDELAIDDIDIIANATTTTPLMRGSATSKYDFAAILGNTTLQGPSTVVLGLGLSAGVVNTTSTDLLTVAGTAAFNAGSSASFVNGPIAVLFPNVNPNNTAPYTIPVGKISGITPYYAPVKLNPTNTNPTTFTTEYFRSAPTNPTSLNAPLDGVSSVEYWDISRAATAPSALAPTPADVTLSWNAASGIADFNKVTLAHYEGSAWSAHIGTKTGNATAGTTTASAIDDFSPFTIGSGDAALPLQLVSFQGRWNNQAIALQWETANEQDMVHFELQRKDANKDYQSVTRVSATNQQAKQVYTYNDASVVKGEAYTYRLKMVGKNGEISYSNEVKFSSNGLLVPYVISNPVTNTVKVGNLAAGSRLQLIYANGKTIQHIVSSKAIEEIPVSQLGKGMYFIRVINGTESFTLRFIKQ